MKGCLRLHLLGTTGLVPRSLIHYNKRQYRQRNCIERVFGHLKINRAIATRYDQLAESFLGMLFLASARYWLKFVHAA